MGRSRVSNGNALLPGIDGRSALSRRAKDILAALISDQSGIENISETRLQLCRRFATTAVMAEALEAKLVNGEAIDLAEHALLSSTLVRIAQRIGLNRRSKTIVPTVRDYIEQAAS